MSFSPLWRNFQANDSKKKIVFIYENNSGSGQTSVSFLLQVRLGLQPRMPAENFVVTKIDVSRALPQAACSSFLRLG